MQLTSCLYETEIWHARQLPRPYSFNHKHFMVYLALDELDALNSNLSLFRCKAPWLYSFDESEYLPNEALGNSLVERVRCFASENGIKPESIARVTLLTNVRVAGYVFNPVSFFFCTGTRGEALCCIVEVGNTFKEKKAYLLNASAAEGNKFLGKKEKYFYVSPFSRLEQIFDFRLSLPDHSLELMIDTVESGLAVVKSGITGRRLALTDSNLLKLTFRYPLATFRVITLIHWHALIMWLRRFPYYQKTADQDKQLDVMRPHASLSKKVRTGVTTK